VRERSEAGNWGEGMISLLRDELRHAPGGREPNSGSWFL
jgi:hypothetical protein